MGRPDQGRTGTKRASAKRRVVAKVKQEGKKKHAPGDLPEMPPSPLAEWLLDPTAATRSRVQIASALGRLTTADLQSALTAQMIVEAEHMTRDQEGFEEVRKGYVMRQRLLRNLMDVVKQTTTGGPLQLIRLVWPTRADLMDPGEDVRLEVPE